MAAHIPDSEFMMVPQGTHVVPLEHRDLVELRVERFLREHLPASPPAPTREEGLGARGAATPTARQASEPVVVPLSSATKA